MQIWTRGRRMGTIYEAVEVAICLLSRASHATPRRTIKSDHKPLEAISNKPLSEAPKSLLRMILSIQTFVYKIKYKTSIDVIIVDALSRAPVEDDKFQFDFSDMNL